MSDSLTPAPAGTPKPIRRTSQLPTSGVELAALATTVAGAWQTSELPALLWLTKADLAALAASFAQHRDAADAAGDTRTPQAKRLQALDKQLAKGLPFVKNYLAEEHEENEGRAYYAEFGIEKVGDKYTLPAARTERLKSLNKLLKALNTHNFDKKKYGTAFWQPLATEYAQLVQDSAAAAGERSSKVSAKSQGEQQLRKALGALIHHIKANYPDTFAAHLRAFGFQKESY
ncbi:hypothetical protein [Hymenobacter psychrotolerans]|uniref:Uncharacterized protein n=1 Tax=Hymenobacter psychrotolerans DSM 18569 TaxID=1121959 RepID=A0A1M7AL32_9BACT|nr:hypothetical protein [Hymenobacter psychrotolerans]SHL43119.1 hypothetical protein SAMN02746009_02751 [Hymenobacter psychrotolerans DSM 18569]